MTQHDAETPWELAGDPLDATPAMSTWHNAMAIIASIAAVGGMAWLALA